MARHLGMTLGHKPNTVFANKRLILRPVSALHEIHLRCAHVHCRATDQDPERFGSVDWCGGVSKPDYWSGQGFVFATSIPGSLVAKEITE